MIHLLRSLFVGYFIAIVFGTIAVVNGYNPVWVALGVWLGGSFLSVAIAAIVKPFEDAESVALPLNLADGAAVKGQMRPDLTARELARWDADLMAERLEADLIEDRQSAADAAAADDRKTG